MATDPHAPHHDVHEEPEFDREIRRRQVFATGIGILAVTAVSMVAMWFLSDYLLHLARVEHLPLTPVQQERREALEETNAQRSAVEVPIYPQLAFPHDVESPVEPRVQVSPGVDMRDMRSSQGEELSTLSWMDRSTGKARLPIDQAMDRLIESGLPRRGDAPPAESDYGSDDVAPAVAPAATVETSGAPTNDEQDDTDGAGDTGAGSEEP